MFPKSTKKPKFPGCFKITSAPTCTIFGSNFKITNTSNLIEIFDKEYQNIFYKQNLTEFIAKNSNIKQYKNFGPIAKNYLIFPSKIHLYEY